MLPDIHTAPDVAREIMRDRLRQANHHRLLLGLPRSPSRGLILRCRIANLVGVTMVNIGLRLRKYGEQQFTSTQLNANSQRY